jgi:hypothetical protein
LLVTIFLISRRDDAVGIQPNGNEANAWTVAAFTETDGGSTARWYPRQFVFTSAPRVRS